MILILILMCILLFLLITIYRIDKIKRMRYYGHDQSKRSKSDSFLTKVFIKKLPD